MTLVCLSTLVALDLTGFGSYALSEHFVLLAAGVLVAAFIGNWLSWRGVDAPPTPAPVPLPARDPVEARLEALRTVVHEGIAAAEEHARWETKQNGTKVQPEDKRQNAIRHALQHPLSKSFAFTPVEVAIQLNAELGLSRQNAK